MIQCCQELKLIVRSCSLPWKQQERTYCFQLEFQEMFLRDFDAGRYPQAKLALVLFTFELQRRWQSMWWWFSATIRKPDDILYDLTWQSVPNTIANVICNISSRLKISLLSFRFVPSSPLLDILYLFPVKGIQACAVDPGYYQLPNVFSHHLLSYWLCSVLRE